MSEQLIVIEEIISHTSLKHSLLLSHLVIDNVLLFISEQSWTFSTLDQKSYSSFLKMLCKHKIIIGGPQRRHKRDKNDTFHWHRAAASVGLALLHEMLTCLTTSLMFV